MKLYGLIGYPLSHSFSAPYFTRKFEQLGLGDHVYRNFPLERIEDFTELLKREPDLNGLNVTIPYKESVMLYLDAIAPEASEIGAVNTICFTQEGISGHNTDWIGFKDSLEPLLSFFHEKPSALILGTGGASKAVAYALGQLEISWIKISRRRAKDLLHYDDLSDELLSNTHLIVNTTPLGMTPDVDVCPPLNYDIISEYHLLYDLVYNPAQTLFLRNGESRGAQTKNGLDMLHLQAEAAWALWQA